MNWEKHVELIKAELESKLGGIVSLKDKDAKGGIDKVLACFCLEFTEEQWRTILDGKYEVLFDGDLPPYSRIVGSLEFFSRRKDMQKEITLESDTVVETRIDHKIIKWYHLKKNDVYIKVTIFTNPIQRKVYSYEIEVAKKEMVPEKHDHSAVMLFVDNSGYVFIQDQMTGTESECIRWMNSKKETCRNSDDQYVLKLIKRRNY